MPNCTPRKDGSECDIGASTFVQFVGFSGNFAESQRTAAAAEHGPPSSLSCVVNRSALFAQQFWARAQSKLQAWVCITCPTKVSRQAILRLLSRSYAEYPESVLLTPWQECSTCIFPCPTEDHVVRAL
mmetsp:Transcript_93770/g.235443  ORF Transcript_93770/g.235443 Transcript_93770/m.235443 type:complete len:128 (-) Transcript_93770:149-532(-)